MFKAGKVGPGGRNSLPAVGGRSLCLCGWQSESPHSRPGQAASSWGREEGKVLRAGREAQAGVSTEPGLSNFALGHSEPDRAGKDPKEPTLDCHCAAGITSFNL